MCQAKGITRLGVVVDHVIPLAFDGVDDKRDPFNNRQLLCIECHNEKTAADFGKRIKPIIGLDGLPVNGELCVLVQKKARPE